MKVRRLGPGVYEVDTPLGTFEVDKIDGFGHGLYEPLRTVEWFVTWPGESTPDAVTETLRDAKALIAATITPEEEL